MSNVKFLAVDMETRIIDREYYDKWKQLPLAYDRSVQHADSCYGYLKPYKELNVGYRCEENMDVNDLFRVLTKKELSPYYRLAITMHIWDNSIHLYDNSDGETTFDVYYARNLDVIISNPSDDTFSVYRICNTFTPVSKVIERIRYICKNNKELNPEDVTKSDENNIRLNYLLFYIQGYCLGMYGMPLFKDQLYYNTEDKTVTGISFKNQEQVIDLPAKLNKDVEGLIDNVINLMGKYTTEYLMDKIKLDIETIGYNTDEPNTNIKLDYDRVKKFFENYVED